MRYQSVFMAVTMMSLAAPASSTAQSVSAEVTLQLPINLTQLGPDVEKVRVGCTINSVAITNGTSTGNHSISRLQDVPVSGGKVVTTVSLAFAFTELDNPVGKGATISCSASGWSTSQQTWVQFQPTATNVSFRTSPKVDFIDSSFVW